MELDFSRCEFSDGDGFEHDLVGFVIRNNGIWAHFNLLNPGSISFTDDYIRKVMDDTIDWDYYPKEEDD